jgi:hypothetical protein
VSCVLLLVGAVLVPGETLDYDVRYGPVTLGRLSLQVLAPEPVRGESCHHFRAELEISRSLSWLFWADYRLESWARTTDLVTLRSYKRTREPNYRAEWTADYFPAQCRVSYAPDSSLFLPDSSRDMVTLWYLFRTLALEAGDTVRVRVHTDRKNYPLSVAVGARRSVRTGAGRFDCLPLTPSAGSPLGSVLLSSDSDRLPVVIRARFGGIAVSAHLRRTAKEAK